MKLISYVFDRRRSLRDDEDGLALTEYLLLLGLLTGAVILAVVLFGAQLGAQWTSWGNWMENSSLGAPADVDNGNGGGTTTDGTTTDGTTTDGTTTDGTTTDGTTGG